jgi:hypothetical protein
MNDVMEFNAIKFALKLSDFSAIGVHLLASTRPVFVDLVDD